MKASSLLLHSLGLAVLLLIAPNVAMADSVPATVSYVEGDAYLVDPTGQTQKITENMLIPVGSTVTTAANGSVGLKLVPGATTVLSSDTDMKVSSMDYSQSNSGVKKRSILLALTKGTISSSLVKNDGNSDFRVSTPEGIAAARGTDWSVTVTGKTVTVAVLDGVVTITLPNGHTIDIPAGKVAVSTTGTGANVTYILSGLTDDQKNELIDAITKAGFKLSTQQGVSNGSVYSKDRQGTLNPANITITPTQSPNQ